MQLLSLPQIKVGPNKSTINHFGKLILRLHQSFIISNVTALTLAQSLTRRMNSVLMAENFSIVCNMKYIEDSLRQLAVDMEDS